MAVTAGVFFAIFLFALGIGNAAVDITKDCPGFPMTSMVVGSLLIIGTVSLMVLPFAAWLAACCLSRTSLYRKIQTFFPSARCHQPVLYIGGSLFISAFMLALFTELAWATMFQKSMAVFDNVMFWLVRYFASPEVDRVMIFITNLGYGGIYLVLAALLLLLLAYLKRWREAAALIICLAGGAMLNNLLKQLFERARPDLLRLVEAAGYSFPSGHAMMSLCFYGMAAFLFIRRIRHWRVRLTIISGVSLLVAAIGISRIYLGVHYATDVVAGYAAGSMWLAFCLALLMWWEQQRTGGK